MYSNHAQERVCLVTKNGHEVEKKGCRHKTKTKSKRDNRHNYFDSVFEIRMVKK